MPNKYPTTIYQLCEIAIAAGARIMESYATSETPSRKDDGSPLTKADLLSHDTILAALTALAPSVPVISEEGNIPEYATRRDWARFYLVDGLDGTKEFIKRNGEFTVNIALIEKGVPVQGVVFAPALAKLYFAEQSVGAFKVPDLNSPRDAVQIFSTQKRASDPLRVLTSRSHPNAETLAYIRGLDSATAIPMGSSLKFALLAEGAGDVYPRLSPTMEWDVAAGDCLFRNSGRGSERKSPLTYNKMNLRNPSFILGLD